MRRLLPILVFSALSLCADVTGKWSGTIQIKDAQGDQKTESAYLILKQEGTAVSGSGGPSEEKQHPIGNGKVEGSKLSFEISMGEGRVMRFDLTTAGDQIDGDVTAPAKDGAAETAKLSVKRIKTD